MIKLIWDGVIGDDKIIVDILVLLENSYGTGHLERDMTGLRIQVVDIAMELGKKEFNQGESTE